MKIITYNIQTDPFEGYNTFKLRLINMCKYICTYIYIYMRVCIFLYLLIYHIYIYIHMYIRAGAK